VELAEPDRDLKPDNVERDAELAQWRAVRTEPRPRADGEVG
jgi:hypothetical protein